MLSEAEGCEILLRLFKGRGFTLARNAPFDEEGVTFVADGWDAWARVGFEYMTHEADDHADLPAKQIAILRERTKKGELFFFIVDESAVRDEAQLTQAATEFLDRVEKRRAAGEGA
jgi:hypothetical protein